MGFGIYLALYDGMFCEQKWDQRFKPMFYIGILWTCIYEGVTMKTIWYSLMLSETFQRDPITKNHIIFALNLNHMPRLEKGCVLINWMAFSLNVRWELCVIWVVLSRITFEYKFPALVMVIGTSLLWLINLFIFWGYNILFTFQRRSIIPLLFLGEVFMDIRYFQNTLGIVSGPILYEIL